MVTWSATRWFVLLLGTAGCLAFQLDVAAAAKFRSDDRAAVAADEVIEDDLYIVGEEVTIDGHVTGDVIAFGRVIRVNGTVDGDFVAAAQAISISGQVGDDARIAAQAMKIDDGAIGGDLIAAGFSLEATKETAIKGDLYFGGYQALLAGTVGQNFKAGLANCEINGTIGGDVHVGFERDATGPEAYTAGSQLPFSVPRVAAGLTFGDEAKIDGQVYYKSQTEADIAESAQIAGNIEHKRSAPSTPTAKAQPNPVWRAVKRIITLLVVGLCVVLIAPGWTRRLTDRFKSKTLASLGFGAVGLIGFWILLAVIVTVVVTLSIIAGLAKLTGLIPVLLVLGGAGCAVLLVGFWFLAAYLAEIVFGIFLGDWVLRLANPALAENRFLSLGLGAVVIGVLGMVPVLGGLVGWFALVFTLGAICVGLFLKPPTEALPPGKPVPLDA